MEEDVTDEPVLGVAEMNCLAERVATHLDPEQWKRGGGRLAEIAAEDAAAFLDALDDAAKPRGFRVATLVVRDGTELIVDEVPKQLDEELVTMKRCVNALEDHDTPTKFRVLQYLVDRFKPEGVE